LSDEQLAAAERIVAAFEEAEADGVASIRVDSRFVDYPVYELARTRLRRHAAYWRETPTPPS
jgi:citrate lyase subunit beta/citryl-CoA lyase